MANLNKVFLMGNLTRDPELRYTPNGTPVCEFGLAVNRSYKTGTGEQRDETCFVDVTMWGSRGVAISEYLTKGQPIFIEGRLRYDSWESAEGRRSRLTVVAENFQFIGVRGAAETAGRGAPGAAGGGAPEPAGRGGSPRRTQGRPQGRPQPKAPAPEEAADEGVDVSDDEIPF